jgi:hypothetical protein
VSDCQPALGKVIFERWVNTDITCSSARVERRAHSRDQSTFMLL